MKMTHAALTRLVLAATLSLVCACGMTPDGGADVGTEMIDDVMSEPGDDMDTSDGTSMPNLANIVGSMSASFIDSVGTSLDVFPVAAVFISASEAIDPVIEQDTKEIASCIVTTTTIGDVITPSTDFELIVSDAGKSGLISNGTAMADLTKASEGTYSGPTDMRQRGFAAGDTVTFSFPGGADIEAFSASIRVPPLFDVSMPDLDNLAIDFEAPFEFEWVAANAERVTIAISTTGVSSIVSASCEFEDEGAGTIPREVMACLIEDGATTTITMARSNVDEVSVRLVGGESAAVLITGSSSLSRTITALRLSVLIRANSSCVQTVSPAIHKRSCVSSGLSAT